MLGSFVIMPFHASIFFEGDVLYCGSTYSEVSRCVLTVYSINCYSPMHQWRKSWPEKNPSYDLKRQNYCPVSGQHHSTEVLTALSKICWAVHVTVTHSSRLLKQKLYSKLCHRKQSPGNKRMCSKLIWRSTTNSWTLQWLLKMEKG